MKKYHEVLSPQSCWNKAADQEFVFILLARDKAAPVAIRAWVDERLRLGMNKPDDPKIIEALKCATCMELSTVAENVQSTAAQSAIIEEPMMQWFQFSHLPDKLKPVSSLFYDLACQLCALVEPGPERTEALRKLLESKDAAVRAKVNPGC